MQKVVTPYADHLIEGAAMSLAEWVKDQWLLRQDAKRGALVHGGGVQALVLYHCPEAMR